MANVAHAFSPKEWTCFVISDASDAGTTGLHATNMYQLDVDSVSYPNLNVTQALDVRSGVGATLKDEDFFQDRTMRVTELSLSGTLHDDVGHRLLLANICGAAQADDTNQTIASGHKILSQRYGEAVTNNASSLTIQINPSDVSNQRAMEFFGCVVTNFTISADTGTEGGRYKWSATLQTGKIPDLDSQTLINVAGSNNYANTTDTTLAAASGVKLYGVDAVLNSFTTTIDYPAVFSGITSTGYEVVSRGAECSVTHDCQVKYDGNTKDMISNFDGQTAAKAEESFIITNNGNFGIDTANAVLTNVALSEGDIMMLDCSLKAVDDGTDELLIVDLSD
tara:strand:- start:22205 stop:23215 length:1011 start_codon:yes stop_codon:yes gene_type:complete